MQRKSKFIVRDRAQVVVDMATTATTYRRPSAAPNQSPSPSPSTAKAAVATYEGALKALAANEDAFASMHAPRPSDWLYEHHEAGQSFSSYAKQSSYSVAAPHGSFDTLLIVVFGKEAFAPQTLAGIKAYVTAFYHPLRVEMTFADATVGSAPTSGGKYGHERGGKSVKSAPVVRRCTGSRGVPGVPQVVAEDLMTLAMQAKSRDRDLSRRVIATMGLTSWDLGLDETGDFWVYGVARANESTGVFSLARFQPSFCGAFSDCGDASPDDVIMRQGCKVVCHELGHLFGLRHCVNLICLMNGSNHAEELARQPMLECPACTLKLTHTIGWNLAERYDRLQGVCQTLGFADVVFKLNTFLRPAFATVAPAPTLEQREPAADTEPVKPLRSRSTVAGRAHRTNGAATVVVRSASGHA